MNENDMSDTGMIATIGEALVDLIEQPDGRFLPCLGGSVCNFTLGLARQGAPTVYLNPLSTDHFGAGFFALLSGSGVRLAHSVRSACPTSIALVSLDEHGSPSYAFHRQGVADRDVNATTLIALLPEKLTLLHTGGLALVPEDLAQTLAAIGAATARGALVSIDVNVRPAVVSDVALYLAGVRRAMRQAHIVKVSSEDLDALGMDAHDLSALRQHLFSDSLLELLVVTRGAAGAALLTRSCQLELAAPSGIVVVDTVGAGDCFHAALIAYLRRAGQLEAPAALAAMGLEAMRGALQHALAGASVNVQRAGCDPASWAQTVQFQAEQGARPLARRPG